MSYHREERRRHELAVASLLLGAHAFRADLPPASIALWGRERVELMSDLRRNGYSAPVRRQLRAGSWRLPAAMALSLGMGCQGAEVKECRDKYLTTHAQVAAVDMNELDSVEQAFAAVESNLAICEKASLTEESKQLTLAKRKLESQVAYLRQIGSRKELTPSEVEELVKKGDPDCPKGQSYQYQKTGKKVRCTGSQILAMNQKEAKSHFTGRGFKIHDLPNGIRAELGSESYTFEYGAGSDARATCVVVFSQAGIAWQETVTRVSGVMPQRLKEGTPLTLGKDEIPYTLQADPIQAILRFGACSQALVTPSASAVGKASSTDKADSDEGDE
jgi:hypothetical protein